MWTGERSWSEGGEQERKGEVKTAHGELPRLKRHDNAIAADGRGQVLL